MYGKIFCLQTKEEDTLRGRCDQLHQEAVRSSAPRVLGDIRTVGVPPRVGSRVRRPDRCVLSEDFLAECERFDERREVVSSFAKQRKEKDHMETQLVETYGAIAQSLLVGSGQEQNPQRGGCGSREGARENENEKRTQLQVSTMSQLTENTSAIAPLSSASETRVIVDEEMKRRVLELVKVQEERPLRSARCGCVKGVGQCPLCDGTPVKFVDRNGYYVERTLPEAHGVPDYIEFPALAPRYRAVPPKGRDTHHLERRVARPVEPQKWLASRGQVTPFPRPTPEGYTVANFRAWAAGELSRLREQGRDGEPNRQVELLFNGNRHLTERGFRDALASAAIVPVRSAAAQRKDVVVPYTRHVACCFLIIGRNIIVTESDLLQRETLFKRDKPILRACLEHIRQGNSDWRQLQPIVDQICARNRVSADGDLIWTPIQEPEEEDVDYMERCFQVEKRAAESAMPEWPLTERIPQGQRKRARRPRRGRGPVGAVTYQMGLLDAPRPVNYGISDPNVGVALCLGGLGAAVAGSLGTPLLAYAVVRHFATEYMTPPMAHLFAQNVSAIVVAPYVEEWCKRWSPGYTEGIVVMEFFLKLQVLGLVPAVLGTIMHVACARLPFKEAVALHTANNVLSAVELAVRVAWGPLTYQISFAIDVNHHVPQLDALVALCSTESVQGKWKERMVQFGVFVAAFVASDSGMQRLLALAQYVATFPKFLVEGLTKLVDAVRMKFQLEGESDAQEEDPVGSILSSAVRFLAGELMGLPEALVAQLRNIAWHTRFSLLKATGVALSGALLLGLQEVARRIAQAVDTKSWAPLFGNGRDPVALLRHLEFMRDNYAALIDVAGSTMAAAKLRETLNHKHCPAALRDRVSPREFVAIATDIRATLGDILPAVASVAGHSVGQGLRRFDEWLAAVKLTVAGSSVRPVPFAIMLYGPPGVGKSVMSKELCAALLRSQDITLEDSAFYVWRSDSNFQDNLGFHTLVALFDDADQSAGSFALGTRVWSNDWIQLVGNTPYPVEKADVSQKGLYWCAPRICMMCTNFGGIGVEKLTKEPKAFYRRFDARVVVHPKAAYSTRGGMLNTLGKDMFRTWDMYDLELMVYDDTIVDAPHARSIGIFSLPELLMQLIPMFQAHRKRQMRMTSVPETERYCKKCFLDTTVRSCGHGPGWDGAVEWLDEVAAAFELGPRIDAPVPVTRWQILREYLGDMTPVVSVPRPSQETLVAAGSLAAVVGATAATLAAVAALLRALFPEAEGQMGQDVPQAAIADWGTASRALRHASVPPTQVPASGQLDEVCRAIEASYVSVEVVSPAGVIFGGRGSIVAPSVVLVPRHYKDMGSQMVLRDGMRSWIVKSDDFYEYRGHTEMILLHVPGLPPMRANLAGHLFETNPATVVRFDEVRLRTIGKEHQDQLMNARCGTTNPTWSAPFDTVGGDCGSWWIVRFNGGWKALGMHYGIYEQVGMAVCGVIERQMLNNSVRACGIGPEAATMVMPSLATVTGALVTPQLGVLSQKTNLGCALERFPEAVTGLTVFGTLPNCAGRSMKTKACRSLFYDATADVEETLCGGIYWGFPSFKAFEQAPGQWTSPVVNSFRTVNNVLPDEELMWAALFDYTSSFRQVATPKARLSEAQAYTGVAGTPFHVINTRTSVGPPFGGAKDRHMCVDDEGEVRLSPLYHDLYRSIDDSLGGNIPCAFANLVPKDEVRKVGKIPRIFCNLSAAYNVAMKQELAPVIAIMRDYPGVFESMVGIDMTSGKALEVPRLLNRVSGQLWDSDATALDKSWSPALYEFVALAFYSIAHCSGAVPLLVWRLVMGLRYAVYETNGDLFNAAWNPSGNMVTVELNGVLMSLCERYVCFRSFPETRPSSKAVAAFRASFFDEPYGSSSPFREVTSLVTYGDDAAKRTNHLNPATYVHIWKNELGIIVTDGSKGADIVPKRLEDLVFLKRRFMVHPAFSRLVTPLDVKTLVRMLRYCKDNKLPLNTHALEVSAALARECAYHTDDIADLLMREVNLHLRKIYAGEIPSVYTVAHWRRVLEADPSASTWVTPETVAAEAAEISLIRMVQDVHTVSIAPHTETVEEAKRGGSLRVAIDALGKLTYQSGDTNTAAEMNDIVLSTPQITTGTATSYARQQNLDAPAMDKFLSRRVTLLTETWSSTDTSVSVAASIQPLAVYLASPNITPKLRNYTYMRGDFVLTVVVAAPPGAYGLYCLTAYPVDGTMTGRIGFAGNGLPSVGSVTQCDWHALIDVAVSTTVEIRLPYAGYFEMLDISQLATSWQLYKTCYSAVATALPSALATANVTYYGHFEEGYEVAVPTYQMGLSSALTAGSGVVSSFGHAVATTAGVVSDVLGAAGEIARGLGFSRTNLEETPTHIMTQSTSSVVTYDGHDKAFVAALQQKNELKGDDAFCLGIERDELEIADIVARKSYLFSVPLTTAQASGTVLFTIPVHPGLCASLKSLSTTAYAGLPFSFWRGDLDFWVYVPVSMFHRCRLQAIWSSNPVPPGAVLSNITTATYSYIFDVVPGKMQKISIGYQMNRPFSAFGLTTFPNSLVTDPALPAYSNGWFTLRVATPLSTLQTADTTSVYVFLSGGKNLQFGVPSGSIAVVPGLTPGVPQDFDFMTVTYQSGVLGDANAMETIETQLVPSPGACDPGYYFGESHSSIRAFIQKPSRSVVAMGANAGGQSALLPLTGDPMDPSINVSGTFSWAKWYACAFFAFAGDEVFRVIPNGPAWLSFCRSGYAAVWSGPSTAPSSYCGPNLGYECVVPYYNPARFYTPCWAASAIGTTAIPVHIYVDTPGNSVPLKMAVYNSVKAGFRLSGFCCCPGLMMSTRTVQGLFG